MEVTTPRITVGISCIALVGALSHCGSRTALDVPVLDSTGRGASDDAAQPPLAGPGSDGGIVGDAAEAGACPYREPSGCSQALPAVDDQCALASDCAIVFQGCCDQFAVGLNVSALSAFAAARTTWLSVCCATVDCAATSACSQQGLLCVARSTTVVCAGGRCRTQCQ